jgi:glycosyltransferase involved in cell wall biosynthesis
MMHVLVLLAQEYWTGPAEGVLQITRGLQARGHRVTFIYTRHPEGHLQDHVDGMGPEALPEVQLPRKGFHPLIMALDWFYLRQYVTAQRVDVIFCHLSHDNWIALSLLLGAKQRPVLVRQVHQSRQLGKNVNRILLYRRADALVVAADDWKARLVDNFHLDSAKVAVIPAGVDTEHFTPDGDVEAVRGEVGAQPGDKLVGMVGRIKPGRGQDLALQAFRRVREHSPRTRLLFIGRGEGRAALEREVAQLGLGEQVRFLGYRTDDLPAIYRALDVHLLLGEGSDGTCRAALEALACGTPVVALPVGALPESLLDGRTGYFAAPTADDIAAKILSVLDGPDLRVSAREHALAHFSIARRVDLAENLFVRLAEQR